MFTVFFDTESEEMPQDFGTYREAYEYAEDRVNSGLASYYMIQSA